jgi:Ni2+-binding GTPase involved in maturation of urease and hydrogenase
MSASHSTEEIVSAISPRSMQVIAIDGFQASGKTTLARSLATHWNLQVISADDYLNRNQGGFFAHLKLEELSDALQKTTPCHPRRIVCTPDTGSSEAFA